MVRNFGSNELDLREVDGSLATAYQDEKDRRIQYKQFHGYGDDIREKAFSLSYHREGWDKALDSLGLAENVSEIMSTSVLLFGTTTVCGAGAALLGKAALGASVARFFPLLAIPVAIYISVKWYHTKREIIKSRIQVMHLFLSFLERVLRSSAETHEELRDRVFLTLNQPLTSDNMPFVTKILGSHFSVCGDERIIIRSPKTCIQYVDEHDCSSMLPVDSSPFLSAITRAIEPYQLVTIFNQLATAVAWAETAGRECPYADVSNAARAVLHSLPVSARQNSIRLGPRTIPERLLGPFASRQQWCAAMAVEDDRSLENVAYRCGQNPFATNSCAFVQHAHAVGTIVGRGVNIADLHDNEYRLGVFKHQSGRPYVLLPESEMDTYHCVDAKETLSIISVPALGTIGTGGHTTTTSAISARAPGSVEPQASRRQLLTWIASFLALTVKWLLKCRRFLVLKVWAYFFALRRARASPCLAVMLGTAAKTLVFRGQEQLEYIRDTFTCDAPQGRYKFSGIVVDVDEHGIATVRLKEYKIVGANGAERPLVNSRLEEGMLGLLQDSVRAEIMNCIATSFKAAAILPFLRKPMDTKRTYNVQPVLESAVSMLSREALEMVGTDRLAILPSMNHFKKLRPSDNARPIDFYRKGENPYSNSMSVFGSAKVVETEIPEYIPGIEIEHFAATELLGSSVIRADGSLGRLMGRPPFAGVVDIETVAVANPSSSRYTHLL